MAKNIYLYYHCDEWRSHASMGLEMATTSIRKCKAHIIKDIIRGNVCYRKGNDNMTEREQANLLHRDWKTNLPGVVFNNVEYGYVDVVVDGEEQ